MKSIKIIRSRLARRELAEFLVVKKEGGQDERVMFFSIIYKERM